ncbi:MAG: PDZ domain-containing protein [Deltaproteobacteria bacterium]|nr:PDZ domain-containing protein [Deltaproteobacteria bacterium]
MKKGIILLLVAIGVVAAALLLLSPDPGKPAAPSADPGAAAPRADPIESPGVPGAPQPERIARAAAADAGAKVEELPPLPSETPAAIVGLGGRPMSEADREALKLPPKLKSGVVVTEVDPTSQAAEASLLPNDVIARAHHSDLTSMEDLSRVVAGREQTMLHVYRNGQPFNVVLHPPFDGTPAPSAP